MGSNDYSPAVGPDGPLAAFKTVGVIECLEHDGRPTLVIDLDYHESLGGQSLRAVFCNASLRSSKSLNRALFGESSSNMSVELLGGSRWEEYLSWIATSRTLNASEDYKTPVFEYLGFVWTHFTVRNRWRLISGVAFNQPTTITAGPVRREPSPAARPAFARVKSSRSHSIPEITQSERSSKASRAVDWTNFLPLTTHVNLFKSKNWSATSLGPLESWSQMLRQMTHFVMSDPRPATLFWGPEQILVYNESYVPIASNKHPALMGSTFKQAWPEVWEDMEPMFESIQRTGQGLSLKDICFFLHRHGYLEETFFSFSMMPLREGNGNITGIYNAVFETTKQVISERRTKTLLSVAVAPNMESFWHDILRGLRLNELEIPFALLYSLDEEFGSGTTPGTSFCNLQGTIGVPNGHNSAPQQCEFQQSREGFIPSFREAKAQKRPLILRKEDGSLPSTLTTGIEWRGFGEPSVAVTFPLSAGDKVLGFLLIGTNPRREYDEGSEDFIQLLSRQMSTSLSSAVLIEQSARSKAELSRQLELRTREVEESRERLARITELMPVGIVSCDRTGKLLFCNDAFFGITAYPRDTTMTSSWISTILDEDSPGFQEDWNRMMVQRHPITRQVRLKKRFDAPDSAKDTTAGYRTTVLVNAYPYFDKTGALKEVTGCFTDISPLKQLEVMQQRRAEEALERAKLSEQLAIRIQEAVDSEFKFKAMAELIPAGMFYLSSMGEVIWANDCWFEITGHEKGLHEPITFIDTFLERDRDLVTHEWANLTEIQVARVTRTFEGRLKKAWVDERTGKSSPITSLVCASQEKNDDDSLKGVFGCMSDISLQKQAQQDALERAALSEQLIHRTQEAAASEKKFKQMAELAPCGMFYIAPDGMVLQANTRWYEMMGHDRRPVEHFPKSFSHCIAAEDAALVDEKWNDLSVLGLKVSFEFRTKNSWINPAGDQSPSFLLAQAFPEKNEDGTIKSIVGCTADISHLKWAESIQTRSRIDAEEAKIQQERFMDVTSHEMRNPLSAILQSADGITTSVNEYIAAANNTSSSIEELIQSNLEAAQIITLCSQHQTRIINDVLTMSKLDSNMLLVTPAAVKPIDVIKGVLKMYGGELQSHDIKVHLHFEPSYTKHKIDWAFCDPARVRQVFINVLTNAMKFTRSEPNRQITVSLGGSVEAPPEGEATELEWFASKTPDHKKDPTLEPDWGDGEAIFLYFAVKDTGKGLTNEEKTRLFHRFSQASPKTHVQYGGSGLGLFISRELTELQGGEIGVASEAGKGSTFAFYIKARRALAQSDSRLGSNSETRLPQPRSSAEKPKASGLDNKTSTLPTAEREIASYMDSPKYIILLVEDNLVNQKVLGKQLRKAGCTVHVANHGQEALDILRQTSLWRGNNSGGELDLILMDLEMPIMDGLTCTRKIRQFQQEGDIVKHVPVVAVTANARTEQVNVALAAGMDDIMPKPFRISELIAMMAKLTTKN